MEGKAYGPFRNPAATPSLTPLIAKICIRCPMLAQSRAPSRIAAPVAGADRTMPASHSFAVGFDTARFPKSIAS